MKSSIAGARSIAAIAEWATEAPQPIRAALSAHHHAPGQWSVPAEATIRRTLARLDADALAGAVGAWLADRECSGPAASRRRAVAVDGKTLRHARAVGGDGRPVHLLAAMDHTSRAVLAQHAVGGTPEEVGAFAAAEFLVARKHAHYLFTVKANQPTLLARCAAMPWHDVPVGDRTRDRGHGPAPLAWPTCCAATGRSKRCTTSTTPPSPRTTPRSAPAPPPTPWRSCATW
jgi:DDE_Tnp_1-associated